MYNINFNIYKYIFVMQKYILIELDVGRQAHIHRKHTHTRTHIWRYVFGKNHQSIFSICEARKRTLISLVLAKCLWKWN